MSESSKGNPFVKNQINMLVQNSNASEMVQTNVENQVNNNQIKNIKFLGSESLVSDDYLDLNTLVDIKSLLPAVSKEQFVSFKEDITSNGIINPLLYITTQEGIKILIDGHTRLQVAIELQLNKFPTKELNEVFNSFDELKVWIIKHQCQRRNLSIAQRLKIAYASKEAIMKLAQENLSKAGKDIKVDKKIDTNQEIANIAGVGRSTVVRYARVIEKASEETKQKLHNDEITINTAHESIVEGKANQSEKKNYTEIDSIEDGKAKIKTGELDCIILLPKGKIDSISNSNLKTGVYFLD